MNLYRKIYKGKFWCPQWMSPDLKRILSRILDKNPETRITIDEIKPDLWFRKSYRDHGIEEIDGGTRRDEDKELQALNAFDIISVSTGLNLSGLFNRTRRATEDVHGLTVKDSLEGIIEKVEAVVKAESGGELQLRMKECGVEL